MRIYDSGKSWAFILFGAVPPALMLAIGCSALINGMRGGNFFDMFLGSLFIIAATLIYLGFLHLGLGIKIYLSGEYLKCKKLIGSFGVAMHSISKIQLISKYYGGEQGYNCRMRIILNNGKFKEVGVIESGFNSQNNMFNTAEKKISVLKKSITIDRIFSEC